jgi:phosphopantothenoylcysteine decarboxylase/phosphopantothenate--cysteine ligase
MTLSTLHSKHILVGITGGIAAYKAAELVRLFIKAGAEVRVVMTDAAQQFITPLTLQALSGNPVSRSLLDEQAELGMGHIELARWADFLIVAPATADFIARMQAGIANDLLTTLILATHAPIALAPAMNEKMWHNRTTQHNIAALSQRLPSLHWFGPDAGFQACGDVGEGRMLEPTDLVARSAATFAAGPLSGQRVVITAGPTREAIDPVRYLSNNSTGKMGFALARTAERLGAEVCLIVGPVSLPTPAGVERIDVLSALDMHAAVTTALSHCDIFIGTAAVADFRLLTVAEQKIKKSASGAAPTLELIENPDIIAMVAQHPLRPKRVIAFAAETQNLEHYARTKLTQKQVDAVVANDVSRTDIGFGAERNEILWVSHQDALAFGPAEKATVADFIFNQIINLDLPHDNS